MSGGDRTDWNPRPATLAAAGPKDGGLMARRLYDAKNATERRAVRAVDTVAALGIPEAKAAALVAARERIEAGRAARAALPELIRAAVADGLAQTSVARVLAMTRPEVCRLHKIGRMAE